MKNKGQRYWRQKLNMGCRTGKYTPRWHERDLWILTCWNFKAESPGTNPRVALTVRSPSNGPFHCWGEAAQVYMGLNTPPRTDRKCPPQCTASEKNSWSNLCPSLLSLGMPANTAYTFWLWSLTLKFRNSRELGRIQQPVCQLSGTEDVASKLLPSIHIPGPRGNTNTLEACEFKLTLWHGLQNTWSYWWKRGDRKRVCKRRMCCKRTESTQTAVWNNDITLAVTAQKLL